MDLQRLGFCRAKLGMGETMYKNLNLTTKKDLINRLLALEVSEPTQKITGPENVFSMLADILTEQQEHFIVITLDGANKVIQRHNVFKGSLNSSMVHPREVFAAAIQDRAAAIILAHNHPSGSLEPSREDRAITDRLKEGGEILGIEILDHVIVSRDGWRSMKSFGQI